MNSIIREVMKHVRDVRFPVSDGADKALTWMRNVLLDYGHVTVADFYDIVGLKTPMIKDGINFRNIGWSSLSCAHVYSEGDYWRLDLPTPAFLERATTESVKPENVNHPGHYQSETGLETIDIIEAVTFDLKGVEAFDIGNVIKYISRFTKKNGLEDLKKAAWYLDHAIKHIENLKKENE